MGLSPSFRCQCHKTYGLERSGFKLLDLSLMNVHFKFSPRKAQAAIVYFAKLGLPQLTVGKICKLLFLADKLHLVQFGRTITGDSYVAFNHGPVPSKTYDLLKPGFPGNEEFTTPFLIDKGFNYPRYSLRPGTHIDLALFSKSDLRTLQETAERHGNKTFPELRALTHHMPEYRHAWDDRRGTNEKVSDMAFEEFFEEDEDAVAGAFEEAVENSAIKENTPPFP